MKIIGRMLLLVLGLTFSIPAVAHAEINPVGQHESPEHDSNKSMKAYTKQQKKYQKKTRKAEKKAGKNAQKKGKQQRQAGY
jgi:hypothetical protein